MKQVVLTAYIVEEVGCWCFVSKYIQIISHSPPGSRLACSTMPPCIPPPPDEPAAHRCVAA
jgi:hypothetical protein